MCTTIAILFARKSGTYSRRALKKPISSDGWVGSTRIRTIISCPLLVLWEVLLLKFTITRKINLKSSPSNSRYVFFEKKRISEREEKTALRIKQEEAFPNGRNMEMLRRNRIWIHEDSKTHYDAIGRLVITGTDGISRAHG